jgi:hypothetical protein
MTHHELQRPAADRPDPAALKNARVMKRLP